jgi:RecA-family ATPase
MAAHYARQSRPSNGWICPGGILSPFRNGNGGSTIAFRSTRPGYSPAKAAPENQS